MIIRALTTKSFKANGVVEERLTITCMVVYWEELIPLYNSPAQNMGKKKKKKEKKERKEKKEKKKEKKKKKKNTKRKEREKEKNN